ncbi:MAG: hypothetical protein AAF226_11250 [Verrucomicrobiota bacterium]
MMRFAGVVAIIGAGIVGTSCVLGQEQASITAENTISELSAKYFKAKLDSLIIDEFHVVDLAFGKALSKLEDATRKNDRTGEGVRIIVQDSNEIDLEAAVSLKLAQIPFNELLRYLTSLGGLHIACLMPV